MIRSFTKRLQDPAAVPIAILDRIRRHKEKFTLSYNWGDMTNPFGEDWDNLIILDACRYDIFKEINYLNGDLSYIISPGSNSKEFMENAISGRSFHDTVYVTANVNIEHFDQGIFHSVKKTYTDDKPENRRRGWIPEHVYDSAVGYSNKYPQKRLVVHFMQPHLPFIGEKAKNMHDKLYDKYGFRIKRREHMKGKEIDEKNYDYINNWEEVVEKGYVNKSEYREMYAENLEHVLDYVKSMLNELNGKTVITADHGELLGENDEYGHPSNCYKPELRKVPWFVIQSNERRSVVSDPPTGIEEASQKEIEDNLRALGYI